MRFRRHRQTDPKADAIQQVRAHMRALGIPEAHLSDEQLVERLRRFVTQMNAAMEPMQVHIKRMGLSMSLLREESKRQAEMMRRNAKTLKEVTKDWPLTPTA